MNSSFFSIAIAVVCQVACHLKRLCHLPQSQVTGSNERFNLVYV